MTILGDDSEEVEEGPLVVDAAGARFGGELGVEIGEGEGVGGFAVSGEAAFEGLGDCGGVGGDGGGEAAAEDAVGVAEGFEEGWGGGIGVGGLGVLGEEAEDELVD